MPSIALFRAPREPSIPTPRLPRHKILEHGGLQMMYGLARLADPDIQAEAATVIANITSTIYDAQIQACHRLRDHLSTAPRLSPPPSPYL